MMRPFLIQSRNFRKHRKNEELLKVNAKYADMHFKTYEQDNYFPVDPEFLKKVKSVVINFRED